MPRKPAVVGAALGVALLTATLGSIPLPATAEPATETTYLVLFHGTGADQAADKAIARAGGRVTSTNTTIGYAYVTSADRQFAAKLDGSDAVAGVAQERTIGSAPKERRARASDIERMTGEGQRAEGAGQADAPAVKSTTAVTPEPLANRQWDMRQIGATATGSYAKSQGKGVRVGIIDTGVDGSHPDIAPNFDKALSRNFVTDIPAVDGPCEVPTTCVDPVDEDDNQHGTHVASTIGSPINGLGIAGVAPQVTLINIRAGQDSGYFFLKPTLDALTYAGSIGVDVVNMSYYLDPWLYNCTDNPADSPAEQAEQRVIRTAVQRALYYARHQGVLPVAALGNEYTDLNNPTSDVTSPDYPTGAAKPRTVDNSCLSVPTESKGVVGVSSTGPSLRKAYYSNWGTEQTDVAAPGGDYWNSPDNSSNPQNAVLAAYPQRLAELNGDLNPDGTPNNPYVVRDCSGSTCGYYRYLQGTSMAAPHAVGVAALVVARNGHRDRANPGLTLSPDRTEALLYRTAVEQACPQPRLQTYTRADGTQLRPPAQCSGPTGKNGFYGHGIVNAYRASVS